MAGPAAWLLVNLWHHLITLPFGIACPLLRPAGVMHDRPVHYLSNHRNTYTHGSTVPYPPYCTMLDFELEVACIVVRELRNATCQQAHDAIGGYMLFNDLSARNVQLEEMIGARFGPQKTKSFGNVLGHVVVTPDEVPDFQALRGSVSVNGEQWCTGDTREALFTPSEVVAYCSLGENIHAGEIIGMGTLPGCSGIEIGKQLYEGDEVSLHMEPFGHLSCTIGPKETVPLDIWRRDRGNKRSNASQMLPLVLLSLLMLLLAVYVAVVPSPIDPRAHTLPRHIPVEKRHFPVFHVTSDMIEQWADGLYAPESLISDGDFIYTSTRDGCVRRLHFANRTNECIIRTPQFNSSHILPPLDQCQSEETHWLCGVPLGMRIDTTNDRLLVIDAYYGLLAVEQFRTEQPRVQLLVNADSNGRRFHFMNNLDVTKDGQVYFTVTSDRRVLREYLEETLEARGNGAVYRYDPQTNKVTLVLDGIRFANGLRLNHDETELFVSETALARIRRIKTRTGDWDLLIDNLPCLPDNLLVDTKRHELVAGCAAPRLLLQDYTANRPWIRRLLFKLPLFRSLLDRFRRNVLLIPVIKYDSGKIVRALYDREGLSAHSVSEAHFRSETQPDGTQVTHVYLGSFRNRYLARMKLSEGFEVVQSE